jgi:hypothetical protein
MCDVPSSESEHSHQSIILGVTHSVSPRSHRRFPLVSLVLGGITWKKQRAFAIIMSTSSTSSSRSLKYSKDESKNDGTMIFKSTISSPTSVAHDAPHHVVVEPIVSLLGQPQQQDDAAWIFPASLKSIRTINPIRAIVDPIAKNIQSGSQRGDGKEHISLAVSTCCS